MSHDTKKILTLAIKLEAEAFQELAKTAKKKEKKKLDPKAKVRNRGTVCVPAESAKDKKDHFPINDEDQARNALARVHQYSSVPDWYSGSLKGLQALVARKVKAKYPKINVGGKDKKKSAFEINTQLLNKYAQGVPVSQPQINVQDLTAKMNAAINPYGYAVAGEPRVLSQEGYIDVPVNAGPNAKWKGTGHQAGELKKLLDPLAPQGLQTKPVVSF